MANTPTRLYKYILTPPVKRPEELYNIIYSYQKFTFRNVFSFQKLLTRRSLTHPLVLICWLDEIKQGSSSETEISLIEMV